MAEPSEDLAAYEARIQAALGRIADGVAKWPEAQPAAAVVEEAPAPETEPAGDVGQLQADLEEERTANAQLNQRVMQIRKRHEERIEEFQGDVAAAEARADEAEKALAKLRRASEDMRQVLAEIDVAAAPDAHLINRAMMAELEALRAERSADAAEIADIMTALAPLVEEESTDA